MDTQTAIGLQSLMDSKNWELVKEVRDQVIRQWEEMSVVGDTEFETLKKTFEREYKINGLVEFFDALYQLAHNNVARIRTSENTRFAGEE